MTQFIEDVLPPIQSAGLNTQKGITSNSASAGIGYATGAGAAVTQASSITTGVEINAITGKITTVASTLAAQATAEFTVTNPAVSATDVVAVSSAYAGAGSCMVSVSKVAAGSFSIVIFNATTATTALNAAVVINFAVIKAVAA